MRSSLLVLSLLFVPARGGAAAVDPPGSGVGGAGAPPDDALQVVDDVDHANSPYPPVPEGSSAFFWRGGLGNWFVSSSDEPALGDAPVDDVVPPRGQSSRAYHVTATRPGTSLDLWAQLHHPQGTGVDLSSYSGVAFWARLRPAGELSVAFGANGQFSAIPAAPQKTVPLSEDWSQVVVRFDDLRLDRTAVSSIDFVVSGRNDPPDLWVDDLAFVCRGNCP